jgi:hypothetical protein
VLSARPWTLHTRMCSGAAPRNERRRFGRETGGSRETVCGVISGALEFGLSADAAAKTAAFCRGFQAPYVEGRGGSVSYGPIRHTFWTATDRATITTALALAAFAVRPARAQVAQLVEHCTENAGVGGSIPPLGTILILGLGRCGEAPSQSADNDPFLTS